MVFRFERDDANPTFTVDETKKKRKNPSKFEVPDFISHGYKSEFVCKKL